jgi:hypothetical protein
MLRRLLRILERLGFYCRHQDDFVKLIQEQHIRSGYAHWSNIYKCRKCGRYRTDEIGL